MTRHSPVVSLLIKASEELAKHHISECPTGWHLAANSAGELVKPTDPHASYWSTTGMIIRLDPVASKKTWPATGNVGQQALAQLNRAAEEQGFAGTYVPVFYVDKLGLLAVSRMFKRAIQFAEIDEPENRRRSQRTAGQGHGAHPRGGESA